MLFLYFCPNWIYYIEGVRAAGEKFSANIVNFKSIGGKICILFTNWGKIMHSPYFSSPFNHFSPSMLFGHLGSQTEKHTPLSMCSCHSYWLSLIPHYIYNILTKYWILGKEFIFINAIKQDIEIKIGKLASYQIGPQRLAVITIIGSCWCLFQFQ